MKGETPSKPAAKGHLHYDHPMAYNSHFRGNTAYNLFFGKHLKNSL